MVIIEKTPPYRSEDVIVFPEVRPEFDSALDIMVDRGHSLLRGFVSPEHAALYVWEIYETLGTVFGSAFGPGMFEKFKTRLPITAGLCKEYERLLQLNSERYPILNDRPIRRADILNYMEGKDFFKHNDPASYGPVNFSLTLQGSCEVTVYREDGTPEDFIVNSGDLWLLRGGGFNLPLLEHELSAPFTDENRLSVVMNGFHRVKGDSQDI